MHAGLMSRSGLSRWGRSKWDNSNFYDSRLHTQDAQQLMYLATCPSGCPLIYVVLTESSRSNPIARAVENFIDVGGFIPCQCCFLARRVAGYRIPYQQEP
jgi:hypothetical protein